MLADEEKKCLLDKFGGLITHVAKCTAKYVPARDVNLREKDITTTFLGVAAIYKHRKKLNIVCNTEQIILFKHVLWKIQKKYTGKKIEVVYAIGNWCR